MPVDQWRRRRRRWRFGESAVRLHDIEQTPFIFRPDVLVTDIGMPLHDGYELIRRIRTSGPEGAALRAVALTAYGRPEDRARALAAGFAVHLAKPVTPTDLVAAVAGLRSDNSAPST